MDHQGWQACNLQNFSSYSNSCEFDKSNGNRVSYIVFMWNSKCSCSGTQATTCTLQMWVPFAGLSPFLITVKFIPGKSLYLRQGLFLLIIPLCVKTQIYILEFEYPLNDRVIGNELISLSKKKIRKHAEAKRGSHSLQKKWRELAFWSLGNCEFHSTA